MERVKLTNMELKDNGTFVVFYMDSSNVPREATMNLKWQSKEIDFLRNVAGVGADVTMTVVEKPNASNPSRPYRNITKIDMNSFTKGIVLPEVIKIAGEGSKMPQNTTTNPTGHLSVRDNIIVAQVILKEAGNRVNAMINAGVEFEEDGMEKFTVETAQQLTTAYKIILQGLEE